MECAARWRRWIVAAAAAVGLALAPGPAGTQGVPAGPLRFLGEFVYPSGTSFAGTAVGELSGLVHDPRRGVYYAVSDDRSSARFYTLEIDLGLGGIADVRVVGLTLLDSDAAAPGVQPYEAGDSDLEDIVLLPDGDLVITSERDRNNVPWVRRFALDGRLLGELPLPDAFVPAAGRGTRPNLAFEGITLSADGQTLVVANEQALAQDGPLATADAGSPVRLLRYDLRGGPGAARPGPQVVYQTEPVFARPEPPDGAADNGVTALLSIRHLLPSFDLLVLERSFVAGAGNEVGLFGVTLAGAQDVAGVPALPSPFPGRTAAKTPLLKLRQAGLAPDNLEAMALGPRLPNGRASLILLSDDNLSPTQRTQFLLFELAAGAAGGLPRTGGPAGDPLPGTAHPALAALTAAAAAAVGLGAHRRQGSRPTGR
jgi:hypothetical protein